MEEMPISTVVASAGFVAGLVMGAVANYTNFCTMGSLSDMVFMEDYKRWRSWVLAMAVAILGTQTLHVMGVINLMGDEDAGQAGAIFLTSNFGWLGAIVGGVLFGFGMTMAGGCANKNLVRVGGGNLKSIVVLLVMGIFAYMTVRGLIGLGRVEVEAVSNVDLTEMGLESQSMVEMLAAVIGAETESIRMAVAGVIGVALLAYCFKDAEFRSDKLAVGGGAIIGALVPVGWWITSVLGKGDFESAAMNSFSFVNPTGESIQYLMTFSGSTINFGIATVGGVIVGSFLTAKATKSFAVEAFTGADDMIRHFVGAAIMGIGGVMALGCTVGQGISGMSTLALGSLLALASIVFGGLWGLKTMEEGGIAAGLKGVFSRD